MSAEISIHDNLLLLYTVECRERRITLRTAYYDREPNEQTDVVFSGVVAYHFEGDNFGTIVFDITEVSPEEVYSANKEVFTRRKNYAWPAFAYNTEQELLERLREQNVKGFLLASSYGMDGFVLASEMRLLSVS